VEPSYNQVPPSSGSASEPPKRQNPVTEATILLAEQDEIRRRRSHAGWGIQGADADVGDKEEYLGLAFSGGGIRSATLNLGILQGLAQFGILPRVDYLSTVSGGGYIGSWLHGVIRRMGGMDRTLKLLKAPDETPHKDSKHDPISFLRKFSSYLAPDVGIFSADFWVILIIWFRNIGLNQMILIPAVAAMTAALLGIGLVRYATAYWNDGAIFERLFPWGCLVTLVALLVSVIAIGKGMRVALQEPDCADPSPPKHESENVWFIAASVFVAAMIVAPSSKRLLALFEQPRLVFAISAVILWVLFAVLQLQAGYRKAKTDRYFFVLSYSLLAAIATAGMTYLLMHWIAAWDAPLEGSWHVIAWGPPLMALAWMIGVGLHIGLLGVDICDFGREWISRLGALVLMIAIGWAALFALMVFGPWWIARLTLAHGVTAASTLGTWITTTGLGIFAGGSSKTSATPDKPSKSATLEWIGKIAPVVFLAGYFLLISTGVHAAIGAFSRGLCDTCTTQPRKSAPPLQIQVSGLQNNANVKITYEAPSAAPAWLAWMGPFVENYWCLLKVQGAPGGKIPAEGAVPIIFIAGLVLAGLMNWRVDINEFSMHHFYKNRLVRCYMGASRGTSRRPSTLTGFDPCDDLPLHELLPETGYDGPYPIVNCTINLNTGSEMAKRERKGGSFVFTPRYTGYVPPELSEESVDGLGNARPEPAYCPTEDFAYHGRGGPLLGTCMAISGAAANPDWGASTSAPLAFLLTIFDVRLGWWSGNTRWARFSRKPGPTLSFVPLVSELFAQTTAESDFVNLSDGGHFENFGVYELVRRGCRFIIVGDGEEDQNYTFESLGGLVRKCRTDFGVEMDIDPRRIRPKNGLSTAHCVVGTIRYPEDREGDPSGKILYMKSSVTGDEPEDIDQYKSVHDDFPQETTANQFFTESQFESYRKLGLHIAQSAFQDLGVTGDALTSQLKNSPGRLAALFDRLYKSWYPPSDIADGVASRLADQYSALIARLNEELLTYLTPQIIRPKDASETSIISDERAHPNFDDAAKRKQAEQASFLYCLSLIQLMENVWSDLHLREVLNRESPANAGWIGVFRYWARQPVFKKTWDEAGYTFNPLFHHFFLIMQSKR
jgi:hypothetical protein